MKRERSLREALEARVRLLETTLQPSTAAHYRYTLRSFLKYLQANLPDIGKPSQLRRDPHLLGWLEHLWKYRPTNGKPLAGSTRGHHVTHLRTLLEMLADGEHPPRPGLLRGEDIPPRQYCLPRPLPPADDARLQQHWGAAADVYSCALWLQRLAGMRIGECVDLTPDCLRHLGDNRWTLHVPHGKPRSERWVPVDDQARVLVERLRFLRTLPPGADPRFLPPRPKWRAIRELCYDSATKVLAVTRRRFWESDDGIYGVRHRLADLARRAGRHDAPALSLYIEVFYGSDALRWSAHGLGGHHDPAQLLKHGARITPEILRNPLEAHRRHGLCLRLAMQEFSAAWLFDSLKIASPKRA